MKRRLFSVLSWGSLLLCVTIVALWVRSYWDFDDLELYISPQRFCMLRSAEGRIYVQQTFADSPYWQAPRIELWSGNLQRAVYSNLPFEWRFAGFGYGHVKVPSRPSTPLTAHVYLMPHAFVVIVFAIAPLLRLRAALRARRARARRLAGRCERCGYDLRASPIRCPECGAAPANATDLHSPPIDRAAKLIEP